MTTITGCVFSTYEGDIDWPCDGDIDWSYQLRGMDGRYIGVVTGYCAYHVAVMRAEADGPDAPNDSWSAWLDAGQWRGTGERTAMRRDDADAWLGTWR